MRLASWILPTLALTTAVGCSSSSDSSKGSGASSSDGGATTTQTTPGTVGQLCSTTSPCATGLSCAQSGDVAGRCTADCTKNLDLCVQQFGSDAVCMNASTCALVCNSSSDCPGGGECVALSGGKSACIANPNGAPDAAPPPNGACTNLGGAFGDTVANGGYRCTPSANGDLSTGVDKCQNGVWVSAYTCACNVQGTPSECFDITSPGTAQCSYGLDSCAQCVSPTGCQAQ